MFFSSSFVMSAENFYVSKDQFGNLVYSDKPPLDAKYKTQKAVKIKTVNWKETIPRKIKKTKKKRGKKTSSKQAKVTQGRCNVLKNKIKEYEESLSNRLEAAEFDSLKKKLSDARWKYRSKC